ncbi:MAG: hypothetical protein CL678_02955 [Bdellovibrionaceae bacterium]|nr:hypothetical protein [Pseudobdellovibrionaceae bacterium]
MIISNRSFIGGIVVPAFNEQVGISAFLDRLLDVLSKVSESIEGGKSSFKVCVVDDGSSDGTIDVVRSYSSRYEHIQVEGISLIKNFGYQGALLAGFEYLSPNTDFVISIDADGEQPPEIIPQLIQKWKEGSVVVHTQRKINQRLSFLKKWSSSLYYRSLALASGLKIKPGMADFKLWDSSLLRDVSDFLPNSGSTRVFAIWLAPNSPVITYEQSVVELRRSRFTFRKMLQMALGGMVRYSDLPLRAGLLVGLLSIIATFLQFIFVVASYYSGKTISGWSSLMIVITFSGGMNSFLLGLLCEYLLRLSFRSSFPKYICKNID